MSGIVNQRHGVCGQPADELVHRAVHGPAVGILAVDHLEPGGGERPTHGPGVLDRVLQAVHMRVGGIADHQRQPGFSVCGA